jgi:deoxyribose-phosphate aldolase
MTHHIPEQFTHSIEYTDVRKELTYTDIDRICLEAHENRVASVVVPSALVRRAAACLAGSGVPVGCYVGYPFGTQAPCVKAREAEIAVEHGASEIEVVPHQGTVRAGRWAEVEAELSTVRRAADAATLKVVVEASYLTDEELSSVARLAVEAGYSFIANTAGFRVVSTQPDTQAAATPETVARLIRAANGQIGAKAIGGIRTAANIARLLEAGITRVAVCAEPGLLSQLAEEAQEIR